MNCRERIQPLLPPEPPKPKGGRPRAGSPSPYGHFVCAAEQMRWEYLPEEMGCGCGMTCWRRLRDWHLAGVWDKVWCLFLDELGLADEIDWSKAVVDSCSVRAVFGGRRTGAKSHR